MFKLLFNDYLVRERNMFSKELKEECGVFGVWGVPHAAEVTYYGLHSLQHRGQEGCGIVSVNDNGELHRVKGLGLVTEVFNSENLGSLHGNMAVAASRMSSRFSSGTTAVTSPLSTTATWSIPPS